MAMMIDSRSISILLSLLFPLFVYVALIHDASEMALISLISTISLSFSDYCFFFSSATRSWRVESDVERYGNVD